MSDQLPAPNSSEVSEQAPLVLWDGTLSPPASPAASVRTPTVVSQAALELKLDQHAASLRRDLLQLFSETRRCQEQEQELLLGRERAAAETALAAKQCELEGACTQLGRLQESFRRQTALLSRGVRWRMDLHAAQQAWRTWRGRVAMRRRVAQGEQLAARHYDVGKLQREVFKHWRAEAHGNLRDRVREAAVHLSWPSVLTRASCQASPAWSQSRVHHAHLAPACLPCPLPPLCSSRSRPRRRLRRGGSACGRRPTPTTRSSAGSWLRRVRGCRWWRRTGRRWRMT